MTFIPEFVTGKNGTVTVKIPVTADGTTKNTSRFALGQNDAGANGNIYVAKKTNGKANGK